MKAHPKTIQALQIELGKQFNSRADRLLFLSAFVGYELETSKDLSQPQAVDIVRFLKEGKSPDDKSWAYFDKNNAQHSKIRSLAIEYGWYEDNSGFLIADLNRLGAWLKSPKCPVNNPNKRLLDMDAKECSKIIIALQSMNKKKYK